jgi:6-phosphogluconolactonase (cycloisomerase 2 family)
MLTPRLFCVWNTAIALGLALTLSACGGGGSHNIPPPSSPFEMLYTPTGSQVGSFHIDTSTGALGTPTTTPLRQSTGAISIAADSQSRFLFVADTGSDTQSASVHVLSIDPGFGTLTEVSGSPFSSRIPAGAGIGVGQLSIHPTGQFLYLGTRGNPNPGIEAFTVDRTTGALTSTRSFGNFGTTGVFGLLMHPSGKFVYAGDGNGHILGFGVDSSTGALNPLPGSPFLVAGTMYDMALDPSGKFLFAGVNLATEQGGFEIWSVDDTTGALQEISAAPVSSTDPGGGLLLMDPGGKFLYAVPATTEIRAYAINSATGQLTPGPVSTAIVSFTIFVSAAIDLQGKFIFMAGAKNDSLVGLAINSSTGGATQVTTVPSLRFSPGSMTIVKLP